MNPEVEAQLKEIVENYSVTLFMKGNPTFPQCGFSARAVAILKEYGVRFAGVDVLADNNDTFAWEFFGGDITLSNGHKYQVMSE